jgi:hypothetical protein
MDAWRAQWAPAWAHGWARWLAENICMAAMAEVYYPGMRGAIRDGE